ncbi:MAG: hypothetical protein HUU26_05995 [Gemmatimonadaceae bacterium]|nr:hypothetical protein [Gemmatimonadaceae bacterium]
MANACSALGFDLVVPLSWGDELVAVAALKALSTRATAPAVLCSCPVVRQRLLHAGNDLDASLIRVASPPVATARYLRELLGHRLGSLSFVGRCPDAHHEAYDRAWEPTELFAFLRERQIDLRAQPDVFVDRIPPDRRRFASLPGGCPSPELLWHRCNERVLVELDSRDTSIDLAQQLLTPAAVLVDAATAMGCSCSGVTHTTPGPAARIAAVSLEPPRSSAPVLADAADEDSASLVARVARPTESPAGPETAVEPGSRSRTRSSGRAPIAVTPPQALEAVDWFA